MIRSPVVVAAVVLTVGAKVGDDRSSGMVVKTVDIPAPATIGCCPDNGVVVALLPVAAGCCPCAGGSCD